MQNLKFIGVIAAIVLGVGSAISCLVVGLTYALDRPTCYAHTQGLGVPARWSFWGDCQVQLNGRWVPLENVRFNLNGQPIQ